MIYQPFVSKLVCVGNLKLFKLTYNQYVIYNIWILKNTKQFITKDTHNTSNV